MRLMKLRRVVSTRAAVLALAACCLSAIAAEEAAAEEPKAAIELGAPFADNAILQRQMPVPVWGWSKPGTKVTVTFAGQKRTAAAGKDGKWMVKLDPLEADANPREMIIADAAGQKVTLKNVLVGEVWMASGQSNMQWLASKCNVGRVLQKQIAERVTAGKEREPVIREAKVTDVYSALHPIEHAEGEWSTDAGDFSAIAYAFAYGLARELQVPIGILNCSFSSTRIEAWVPREGFSGGKDEYTRSVYRKILESDPSTPEHKAAWSRFYREVENALRENETLVKNGQPARAVPLKTPGNTAGNRDASWLFNARINPMIPYAIRGAIWNQGYANSGDGLTYYDNLHSLVRGWRKVWNRPDLPVYFHQFYCPGQKGEWNNHPDIGGTAEMRLGTWLARDIPNTGMASQIDITGGVHYYNKTVPGQRLALHALKKQYGKKIVADGPMFKSYTVDGSKLVITFDHAEGGLVVAETDSNHKGIAIPKVLPDGDSKVALFYIADADRVWHKAAMRIDGEKVVLAAPGVKAPRGVSYATGGVGFQPNLYNRALLPMTPFIYYDHKLVTSKTWPDSPPKVAGYTPDPNTVGIRDYWRKMPILSTQFRDNAVLQAGVPVTIWGSVCHDYGFEPEGEAVIEFSFAGVRKTIPVAEGPSIVEIGPTQSRSIGGGKEWRVTLPPMKPSAEPKTLKVTFRLNGEVAHERVCTNIVVGDVWYVAAPQMKLELPAAKPHRGMVRVMTRKAKRSAHPRPSRYSVCVSRTPKNRFASEWNDAEKGFAAVLGERIHARTGNPVGIIFMQNTGGKNSPNPPLKSWIAFEQLAQAPSLAEDYAKIGGRYPGYPAYNANIRRYVAEWRKYWSDYIPAMIADRSVPDGSAWGILPSLSAADSNSEAAQTYNVLVHSFTPAALKGIVFFSSPEMVAKDEGASFGSELSVLANCWTERFGAADPHFFYTIPSKELAPKIIQPQQIKCKSTACEVGAWSMTDEQVSRLIDRIVRESYP
jgi:sialate O-acetylesterase